MSKLRQWFKNLFAKLWELIKDGLIWLWQWIKKFLTRAYMNNTHVWMYAVGGSIFGLLAQKIGFLHNTLTNTSYGFVGAGLAMLFVFLFAIKVYAVSEMKKTGFTIGGLFGSYFNYVADLFGDCTLALFMALLVLLV